MQSMKCSNQFSYQGNMVIISKERFSILLNGFVFLAELDKPSEFEKSLACDVHLVCATQKT